MKRILLILMLALLPLTARADYCKIPDASYIHAGRIGADWWVYWWCEDGSLQWGPVVSTLLTPATVEASAAFAFGLTPSFPSYPAGVMLPPLDDPVVVALEAAMFAAASADAHRPQPPAPTGWFVANNGNADRPMYSVTDGVRSTKANGERATVGDRCRCDPPYRIDEGRTTYCALDGRVPLVESFTVGTFSVAVCKEIK
jgi:hypothetical protein